MDGNKRALAHRPRTQAHKTGVWHFVRLVEFTRLLYCNLPGTATLRKMASYIHQRPRDICGVFFSNMSCEKDSRSQFYKNSGDKIQIRHHSGNGWDWHVSADDLVNRRAKGGKSYSEWLITKKMSYPLCCEIQNYLCMAGQAWRNPYRQEGG